MLTYWLIGEDPAKRIARLKPPIQLTGKRSRMYPHCQNTLHKISSLPILRAEDYSEREPESIETDKLLSPTNGLVARKVNTGEIRSVPCYKRHGATSPRSVSGEKDWSGRPARRSSSVKIKFNDDIIPEHEIPVEQKRRDSLWENFTTRDCPEDVATHSHEVSPLLHPRDSTELDEIRIANGMARSSSADTSIWWRSGYRISYTTIVGHKSLRYRWCALIIISCVNQICLQRWLLQSSCFLWSLFSKYWNIW